MDCVMFCSCMIIMQQKNEELENSQQELEANQAESIEQPAVANRAALGSSPGLWSVTRTREMN